MLQKTIRTLLAPAPPLYQAARRIRDSYRAMFGPGWLRRRVDAKAARGEPVKIIIGAGGIPAGRDWIPTDMQFLNLMNDDDWKRAFGNTKIDAIVAEHVWEHLAPEDGKRAAAQCHKYLKPGGHLRIAVPDGNNPDPRYIDFVKPGGSGPGADDHKVLYTYQTMSDMLQSAGFKVRVLEYFDSDHNFQRVDWSLNDGGVCRRHPWTEKRSDGSVMEAMSLIADGVK
jgi:predicted SAM-dependent methyltransferase